MGLRMRGRAEGHGDRARGMGWDMGSEQRGISMGQRGIRVGQRGTRSRVGRGEGQGRIGAGQRSIGVREFTPRAYMKLRQQQTVRQLKPQQAHYIKNIGMKHLQPATGIYCGS